MLTLIIELPLSIFILIVVWFIQTLIPLQFALEVIHVVFIILEIIFGYIALRTLARYQISRFHYKQFDLHDNLNNNDNLNGNYNNGDFTWIQNAKSGDNIVSLLIFIFYLRLILYDSFINTF